MDHMVKSNLTDHHLLTCTLNLVVQIKKTVKTSIVEYLTRIPYYDWKAGSPNYWNKFEQRLNSTENFENWNVSTEDKDTEKVINIFLTS